MSATDDDVPAILGGLPLRSTLPAWPPVDADVDRVLAELAATGDWGRYHGPHTEWLIERLRAENDCEHAILCASGTAAVEFALRGVGVTTGDEVILAAYDFKANFQNVLALGATPVLVDIGPNDASIDVTAIGAAITDRTRAVLVSHLHGGMADMPSVVELATRHGVAVVEDACQVTGACLNGRPAGSWGDVGVHSFGGSKLLTSGRGGAIVTGRDDVAQRIRLVKERGNDVSPLSEMQAAVLRPQFEKLDARNAHRAANVQRLPWRTLPACEQSGEPDRRDGTLEAYPTTMRAPLASDFGLVPFAVPEGEGTSPAFYKLGFRYESAALHGLDCETFCNAMRAEGIPLDPGFRSLHLIHSRRRFRALGDLPNATALDANVVVLHHPFLLEPPEAMDAVPRALERLRHFVPALLAATRQDQ